MKRNEFLYWTPRVLGILFILFITLFALDAGSIIGFIMHMIPTFVLIGVLFLSWYRPLFGGPIYIGLGLFYMFGSNFDMDFITYLIMVLPLWITGGLFLREHFIKRSKSHQRKK